jgi:hypothetical protein
VTEPNAALEWAGGDSGMGEHHDWHETA